MTLSNSFKAKNDLAALLRVISHMGWDELTYTHASVRIDENSYVTNDFTKLFEEHNPENVLTVDMTKPPAENQNAAGYHIHKAIYQARPDVNCVIHTHTPETIAVASSEYGLQPFSQASSLLIPMTARMGYYGVAEEDNVDPMLEALADNYVLLMANHGALTVGNRPAVVFHRMFRLQRACEAQVMMNGQNTYTINDEVLAKQAENLKAHNYERPGTDEMWAAIKRKAKVSW